jgi:hypothetical protein
MFTRIVRSLFTTPIKVNVVAETALRHHHPLYAIPVPVIHDRRSRRTVEVVKFMSLKWLLSPVPMANIIIRGKEIRFV